MILLTGGAGFIGSNVHAALYARGRVATVVDWLGEDGKWRNLQAHPPAAMVRPERLDEWLDCAPPLDAVVHLGAISATTASDGDLVWHTNVETSWRLWTWCAEHRVPFIYASSAATYGAGEAGFEDGLEALDVLRPLNLYGWSKHAFDLKVRDALQSGRPAPPQWAGLKLFNVFGPNEYHKGRMISVVKLKHDEVARGEAPSLFCSDRADVADGEQRRDFVWVGDVVDVVLWLLDTPGVSGLFNVGTGQARTYLDLAHAVCDAAGRPNNARFVPMPDSLRGHYQSFTEARTERLRDAGFAGQWTPLEEGVRRYVQQYLANERLYA